MKHLVFSIALIAGLSAPVLSQVKKNNTKQPAKPANSIKPSAPVMKTLNDSFSYSVGLNVASSLKEQGVEKINTALLAKAISDLYNNQPVALTTTEVNHCLQTQMGIYNKKKSEEAKKKSAEELAKGRAFLNENKSKPGVISLPDGLQYLVIESGASGGIHPTVQDTVVVDYVGTLIDGTEFDSSTRNGGPISFPLGGVIKGWTEILQHMTIGDKWKVFIPNELAYGERNMGPTIPAGAALIFEITLHDIKQAAKH